MKTIILTGGGTAGHVIPNIALIPELRQHFDRIVYIGSENGIERELISNQPNVEYYPITTVKFIRSLSPKNLAIPFKLSKGKRQALKIIDKENPAIIFSKGGFVSVPVVTAGKKRKIPMVAHESDLSLGLANRLTRRKVNAVCTTFRQTADELNNGVFVGSPMRKEIFNGSANAARQAYHLDSEKPVLLVMGGSLGSERLNHAVRDSLDEILNTHQIIHLTGKSKSDPTIKRAGYQQIEYTDRMQDIFAVTDIAITRGGSNAIHEFLALGIPMLIVPLAKGSRGDQIQNAMYFEKKGYALTLLEPELSQKTLVDKLTSLINRSDIIRATIKDATPTDAIDRLIMQINKYARKD